MAVKQRRNGSLNDVGGSLTRLDACSRGLERCGQNSGELALLFVQMPVAGTQRESVRFPNGCYWNDSQRKIQILDHALNDGELLRIFFAEIGAFGLDDLEQL